MLNEGNQIHNFISSSGSGTVINYGSGSGSDFLTSLRFRFRFHKAKSYGSYGSGSTTLHIEKSKKNLKDLVAQLVIIFCPPGSGSAPVWKENRADP
jgi:hypothetical protein